MKKLIAILLALLLTVSLGVTAFAADPAPQKNDSITVNNAKVGETYKLYKLFDLSVNSETSPTAYSYTVNADWAAFFGEGGAGASYVTIENGYVTGISDAAALAKAAAEWSLKPAAAQSVTVAAGASTAVFSGLEDGYWLITSTLGTVAMTETTPDANAVTVNEKNPEDTITKQVQEDSTGAYGSSNDAQIGDTVHFQTVVTLVKGTRNVVVHDAMNAGLSFNANSVAVTGLTVGTDYTVNTSPTDGDTFEITFTETYLNGLADGSTNVTITYSAVLNENAVSASGPAIAEQTNSTRVSYGDNQSSLAAETKTTTHKFSVFKHAENSTDNLAGAVFSLKKAGAVVNLIKLDDNNYRVANGSETGAVATFTTVAQGDIVIWGVDKDSDYTLLEVTPPDGYNELSGEVAVTVNDENSTQIDVENKSGAELPSTGGIGTTLFYVVGGLLVAGALVVLVSKKRMEE